MNSLQLRHHFSGGNLIIHKAIQNLCCFQIIEKLIQTWPESLQERNNYGKLPLHLECIHLSYYNSMRTIVLTYPQGLTIRYNNTQLPLHNAVARELSSLVSRIIRMVVSRNAESVNETTYYGWNVLHIALKVKNVPECMITIWAISYNAKHMRKQKKMTWHHYI